MSLRIENSEKIGGNNNSPSSGAAKFQALSRASLICLPAVIAGLGLQVELSAIERYVSGGPTLAWINLCTLVITPYAFFFVIAAGHAALPRQFSNLDSLDLLVVKFFVGAAWITILGITLGFVGLLHTAITLTIFLTALFIAIKIYIVPKWPKSFRDLLHDRIRTRDRFGISFFWFGFSTSILYLLIAKGVMIDLLNGDVIQLYFPFFADVREQGAIWFKSPDMSVFGFLFGRGRGLLLFFSSFTNEYFIQTLSVFYLGMIALIAHRLAAGMLPFGPEAGPWPRLFALMPSAVMLLTVWTSIVFLESGRLHLEIGAFVLFLAWAGICFLKLGPTEAAVFRWTLTPVVAALPVMMAQVQLLVAALLLVATIIVFLARGMTMARHIFVLTAIGTVSALASLLFNQLQIGIAEVNPAPFFLHWVNESRFGLWSSRDLLLYLEHAQSITTASLWDIQQMLAVAWRFVHGLVIVASGNARVPSAIFFLVAAIAFATFVGFGSTTARHPLISNENWYALAALVLYLFVMVGLVAMSSHGSLDRLMVVRYAFGPLIGVIFVVLLIGIRIKSQPVIAWLIPDSLSFLRGSFYVRFFAYLCIFASVAVHMQAQIKRAPFYRYAKPLQFSFGLSGLAGANKVFANMRPHICLELDRIVPADNHVLPLNGILTILPACYATGLLPRRMMVDTLDPGFVTHYGEVVTGIPEAAEAILRRFGVDYFLILRQDLAWWGPGQSALFDQDILSRRFDLVNATSEYWLLTWRNSGDSRLDHDTAAEISLLRTRSRGNNGSRGYWLGAERLRQIRCEEGRGGAECAAR